MIYRYPENKKYQSAFECRSTYDKKKKKIETNRVKSRAIFQTIFLKYKLFGHQEIRLTCC